MTNNPDAVKVTQADLYAADKLCIGQPYTCFDCRNELTAAFAKHRIAAEKRRQDVTALYAYEAGFEGAESILREHAEGLAEALEPFANCVEQIDAEEDDEEWAKFRLLIKHYRAAAKALAAYRKFAKDS